MIRWLCFCALAGCALPRPGAQRPAAPDALLIDAHADSTQDIVYRGYDFGKRHATNHEDLPRLREGGVSAQIFSIFLEPRDFPPDRWFSEGEHQLLALREALSRVPGMALAQTAQQVRDNRARGQVSALFGIEGGHLLQPGTPDEQLAHLRRFAELGARYLTLTWSNSDDLGGSSGDAGRTQGLTDLGRRAISEMERLGVVVDLSHVSDPLFWDAIRAARKPVIASHSSARQLANVPRNLTDAQLEAVGKNGGAVCVNFFPAFLDQDVMRDFAAAEAALQARFAQEKTPRDEQRRLEQEMAAGLRKVPLERVAEHIEHIAQVAGIDHVCLGSDFDGIPMTPAGLEDASRLPALSAALRQRGMSETDLHKLLGENLMRVLAANEPSGDIPR